VQKFIVIISMFISFSPPASASGEDCNVVMSLWQSRSAAILWAESNGWEVYRVKIDDGCYEIYGIEEDGLQFEVKIDPSTFEIMEFEYEPHGYRERIRATDPPVAIQDIERE